MKKYIVSTSFNKGNQDAWWLSCEADDVLEVVNSQMIEGYEIYLNRLHDEVIVKYPEKTYFIFRIG